jgi:hypothetical protein
MVADLDETIGLIYEAALDPALCAKLSCPACCLASAAVGNGGVDASPIAGRL